MRLLLVVSFVFLSSLIRAQEFPFTLTSLLETKAMTIDEFNKTMINLGGTLREVDSPKDGNPGFMQYMIQVNDPGHKYPIKVTFSYGGDLPSSRLLIEIRSQTRQSELINQIVNSNFSLIKNYSYSDEDFDEFGQVYQNSKNTIISYTRDFWKINKNDDGSYSSVLSYSFWLFTNTDFNKNVNIN